MEKAKVEISLNLSNSNILEMIFENLKRIENEYSDDYTFDFCEIKSLGITESIIVTIVGSVASHLIIKLIDKLTSDKQNQVENNIKIELIHINQNVNFIIPQQSDKCIEHFRELEGYSENES